MKTLAKYLEEKGNEIHVSLTNCFRLKLTTALLS